MRPEDRLAELGVGLPAAPPALADYELAVRSGSLLFLAGHAPLRDGEFAYVGKVGREFTLAEGRAAAELTACNMLATLVATLGELSRVTRVVKLLGCTTGWRSRSRGSSRSRTDYRRTIDSKSCS